ncbi:DAO domain containing protein [Naviculisporaceae sp. PSN 640]
MAPETSGLPSENPTKSYWLKDPSPILLGHRTTDQLPAEADVVIVGSGITGAFAGWFLKMGVDPECGLEDHEKGSSCKSGKHNGSVVMLEAREVCSGATGRNGGHCQPLVYFAPSSAEFELETYHFLDKLIEEHGIPCDWVKQSGVHVYLSQDYFDFAQGIVEHLQDTHPHLAAQVSVVKPASSPNSGHDAPAGTSEEEGIDVNEETLSSLRIPHAKGAILQQHAASVWPYKLVSWLLEHLLSNFTPEEFNLQTNTPVTSLRPSVSHTRNKKDGRSTNGNNKWILSTPRGDIIANKVILATNGYTSYLIPKMADMIFPVRGQMAALLPPSPAKAEILSLQRGGEEPLHIDMQDRQRPQLKHAYVFLASGSDEDGSDEGYNTKDDHVIQRPISPTGGGGEFMFGGGRDFASPNNGVGVWQDDTIDEDVSTYLRSHLSPPLDLHRSNNDKASVGLGIEGKEKELLQATYQWTGIMGFTRGQYPLVGPVPASLLPGTDIGNPGGANEPDRGQDSARGVWICAGYNGHGMPVAPLCARAVVEQVLGRSPTGLPEGFELTE